MIEVSYKSYLFYLQILTDHDQDCNNDLKYRFYFISIYKKKYVYIAAAEEGSVPFVGLTIPIPKVK